MKTMDGNGLVLCDIQSELFEDSINLDCSSEIFIRRFMNSKFAIDRILEAKNICLDNDYTEVGLDILKRIRKGIINHNVKQK